MKEYILKLSSFYTNQIYHELKEFGLEVIWVSNLIPNLIAVNTNKTTAELEQHVLINKVSEVELGTFID